MDIFLIIGIAGMTLILAAFLMGQFKKVAAYPVTYNVLNLIGSCMMIAYAYPPRAYPFIILNIVWALASVQGLYTTLVAKKK